MGTASFTVTKFNKSRGTGSGIIASAEIRTSGVHATTGTASNVQADGGDLIMAAGEVFQIHADAAMRVAFGGTAATTTTGHYIPAGAQVEFEVSDPTTGTVSAIDA